MDFADFMKGAAPAPAPAAQATPWTPPVIETSTASAPAWPIAVYQALGDGIPGEPFVAYPMIPQKKGKVAIMVRCGGATADAARAKAQEWIDGEVAKLRRAEDRAKSHKKAT